EASVYPLLVGFNALGGGAAPLFVTLAGAGTSLFVHKRAQGADRTLVQRGLVLMLFGLLLNYLTPSWFSLGSWFVLHMMGFAMATAPLWRRLSTRWLLALSLAVIFATVFWQQAFATPVVSSNAFMSSTTRPGGALRLMAAEGHFPVFPWLSMFLLGMVVGRWVIADRLGNLLKWLGVLLALACTLIVGKTLAGQGLFELTRGTTLYRLFGLRLGFYPATPAIMLLLQSLVLVLAWLALVFERRRADSLTGNSLVVCFGRASLTLLLVHVVLFREISRPLGLWRGVSAGMALSIIAVWILVTAWLAQRWQRVGYRYGAEWLLRKLAG
ncbi:MAG: DUF418 domain-containing transporter, partial [Nannocystaceae bacterium]